MTVVMSSTILKAVGFSLESSQIDIDFCCFELDSTIIILDLQLNRFTESVALKFSIFFSNS